MENEPKGKMKQFCDNYLANGLNATQAYLDAKYKVKSESTAASSASRLLRNDKVKEYIAKRLEILEQEKIADATEILKTLTRVIRREELEQQVTITKNPVSIRMMSKDGDPYDKFAYEERIEIVDTKTKNSDVVRAAEILGKYHSLWTDKTELTGELGVVIVDDID
uniref:terminase small subunit n=1 Tax=Jeotgalibaca porci TaxID=1868793 RepID=UPI0035A0F420